jgi:hypothetical protein
MAREVYLARTPDKVLLRISSGMEVEVACEPQPGYYVIVLSREQPWEPEEFFVFAGRGEELEELPVQSKLSNKMICRMVLHARHLQIGFVPKSARRELKNYGRPLTAPTVNCERPQFFKYEVVHCP